MGATCGVLPSLCSLRCGQFSRSRDRPWLSHTGASRTFTWLRQVQPCLVVAQHGSERLLAELNSRTRAPPMLTSRRQGATFLLGGKRHRQQQEQQEQVPSHPCATTRSGCVRRRWHSSCIHPPAVSAAPTSPPRSAARRSSTAWCGCVLYSS